MSLSRSALYHYFTSKEEILGALVEEHAARRTAAYAAIAGDESRPAGERLRTALRATITERLTGGPRLRALDQLAIEMPGRWQSDFDRMLTENSAKPPRERLTLIRLFED